MTLEYDLVVVGSSWAGIYAAKSAVRFQARVALVTQTDNSVELPQGEYLPNDTSFNCSLAEIGDFNYSLENGFFIAEETNLNTVSLDKAQTWIENGNAAVKNLNSLSSLAALGVDVIVGKGEFFRLPKLGLQVKQRRLRSRRFLLATGSYFLPDFGDNDGAINYLTLRDLAEGDLANLPSNIIIVGGDPTALELAQTLARFEKKITLVVKQNRILPQEDRDLSTLVQAKLEAEGINIFTNSVVSQIKQIDNLKWLQAGNRALSADEIIIADYRRPNIRDLNLAGVDVKYDEKRVYVDRKLATTNPHIYACGDLIGGYCLPNIARYEVNLILKNTLFFSWYKTNYHALPWAVLTRPKLARVGLNERQAKQQYKGKVYVIRQYFNNTAQGQILDSNPGMCKLLISRQGEILGCSLFGDRAVELITIPALMMQHKIKLDHNPMRGLTSISIPTIYPSMTEILELALEDFYQQKIQQNSQLSNRLKRWFSWRKNK
ncbi:NAD(P)/FAD-dependent oxidoreductase [Waterburya agarophytonicola K14]|uniref:NAD(P)/FAD-dependent oxidoreductase n=1 Tax=Waterburya agarophytonicola KI4 TaxID=2874699 RepID=A0A964BTJ0_9CYAN|nr:NAD(P)/FAD-dependent oxidoreductase [Waterburya agarophytonicola]MCC0178581.1 NAD(P)/FAD-dependent oxidoreductase [Waterburya agarophytonicola KI4]